MADRPPYILVLAGVNGAGKSSLLGSMLEENEIVFFNPDAFAKELISQNPACTQEEANIQAWNYGVNKLESAIDRLENWAFETTLGGNSITGLLLKASKTHDLSIMYCGLDSPELHIDRVRFRVSVGGHDIPEAKIRDRWETSRLNLIKLMPVAKNLKVFDNSSSVLMDQEIPEPTLLLEMYEGQVKFPDLNNAASLSEILAWAKPLVAAAIDIAQESANSNSQNRI